MGDLPPRITPVLKLRFCPPADQPRAVAEAQPKRTHGAATPLGPDRVVVLPPPLDEHLGLNQRVKRPPFQQLVSKLSVVAADVIRHPPFGRPSRPPAARRPTGANSCRCTTTAIRFKRHPTNCPRSISTRFEGRRDPPPASRTQGRAAPTVKNYTHSGGLEQFMLRRSWLEKTRNALCSPESIAHRGFNACGSAVDRAILSKIVRVLEGDLLAVPGNDLAHLDLL